MREPFVVGVYYGCNKPKDFNEFLKPFVNELKFLQNNFVYNHKTVKIIIRAFICDAPARAAVKGIKGHNAPSGCVVVNVWHRLHIVIGEWYIFRHQI